MPTIGKMNKLLVVEKVADGLYLDGAELEEIFLPQAEVPKETQEGDELDVFLYLDSEDQIIATSSKPNAVVGDFALLNTLSVGRYGAFLDWGISKDLLLPHSEQAFPVEEGRKYLVYVFRDKRSGRIAATTRFHFHFEESSGPYKTGDQVDLLIVAKSELGYKAVFNDEYLGLLHAGDLSQPLGFGERIKGWIKAVRDDGKVDLSINTLDNETRNELEQQILDRLNASENGSLAFSDKSPADDIYKAFKVSKKNFKRAISGLYKKRLIIVEPDLIRLSGNTKPYFEKYRPPKVEKNQEKQQDTGRQSPYKKTKSHAKAGNNESPDKVSKVNSGSVKRDAESFKNSLKKAKSSSKYEKSQPQKTEHANAHIYSKGKKS